MKTLQVAEANALVVETAKKMSAVLRESLEDVAPGQQWLVAARIFNSLFYSVYRPCIHVADKPTGEGDV